MKSRFVKIRTAPITSRKCSPYYPDLVSGGEYRATLAPNGEPSTQYGNHRRSQKMMRNRLNL